MKMDDSHLSDFREMRVLSKGDFDIDENPSQPPKNEFAKGRSKSESILRLEHFLKPCVLCDYKEKEKTMLFDVIWSLGATSNLTQFYFKVEVK